MQAKNRMKKNQQGFTLMELMVVVAIVGILAMVAIQQYQNHVARTQVTRVMSETSSLRTTVEACLLDGKKTVGTASGQCDLGWANSNLIAQDEQAGQVENNVPQSGLQVTLPQTAEQAASIVATFGGNATVAIAGKNLSWIRNIAGTWECKTTEEEKYAPAGCTATQTQNVE